MLNFSVIRIVAMRSRYCRTKMGKWMLLKKYNINCIWIPFAFALSYCFVFYFNVKSHLFLPFEYQSKSGPIIMKNSTDQDILLLDDSCFEINQKIRKIIYESNYSSSNNSRIDACTSVYKYTIAVAGLKDKKYKEKLKFLKREEFNISMQLLRSSKKVCPSCIVPNELFLRSLKLRSKMKSSSHSLILTVKPLGRLGNVMGEYASLFALGKLYNVTVFISNSMQEKLKKFQNITMKKLPEGSKYKGNCFQVGKDKLKYNYAAIELAASGLFGPGCFLIVDYTFEMQLFNIMREDIVQQFTFIQPIREKVHKFFTSVTKEFLSRNKSISVYVGIHVRKTDYIKHIKTYGGELPGAPYFSKALTYYRNKYHYPLFIASSDNQSALHIMFEHQDDVVFTDGASPGEDMAILSSCNHSIITLGSYGFWSGYLAGGEVVYPQVHTTKNYRFNKNFYDEAQLHNFIPLDPN